MLKVKLQSKLQKMHLKEEADGNMYDFTAKSGHVFSPGGQPRHDETSVSAAVFPTFTSAENNFNMNIKDMISTPRQDKHRFRDLVRKHFL